MTARGVTPGPLVLLAAALCTCAFASSAPLVLVACAVAAVALCSAAPGPRRLYLLAGLVSGVAIAVLNPFLARQGDLVLVPGPALPVLDLEITAEELAYGIAAGLRLFAVTVVIGAVLGAIDRDRLQAAAERIAPRSALTVALAARLAPTLRRDATDLAEAARLRGLGAEGGRREALRSWGPLLAPLTASALERGLEQAEAMTARGYGAGRATRLPEAPARPAERLLWGSAALAVAAAALTVALPTYLYYPRLDPILGAGAGAPALAILAAGLSAALLLRRSLP